MLKPAYNKKISPRPEIGPGEQLTKSRPISAPEREARAAAMTVSTGIRNVMFQFMVMLAVNHTALICSASGKTGQWAVSAVLLSWGEGLRIAATLIPAPACGSLSPVELSERGAT
jgi:hypothetical protein